MTSALLETQSWILTKRLAPSINEHVLTQMKSNRGTPPQRSKAPGDPGIRHPVGGGHGDRRADGEDRPGCGDRRGHAVQIFRQQGRAAQPALPDPQDRARRSHHARLRFECQHQGACLAHLEPLDRLGREISGEAQGHAPTRRIRAHHPGQQAGRQCGLSRRQCRFRTGPCAWPAQGPAHGVPECLLRGARGDHAGIHGA